MGGGGGRGGWFGGEGGASFVLVYVFLVLWDYVVGLRSWAWDLFLSGTFGLGWVGLSYVSKSADDRILERKNRKTEMLFGHW